MPFDNVVVERLSGETAHADVWFLHVMFREPRADALNTVREIAANPVEFYTWMRTYLKDRYVDLVLPERNAGYPGMWTSVQSDIYTDLTYLDARTAMGSVIPVCSQCVVTGTTDTPSALIMVRLAVAEHPVEPFAGHQHDGGTGY